MAGTYTYPGVYIEEIPSGVRTIAGVSTSIGAFIGWAARGPTDRAVLCLSYEDFDRVFGGLDARSYLGYAVQHFFANGGRQTYVIRLASSDAKKATAVLDGLEVEATGPGTWAHAYKIKGTPRADAADRFRLDVVETSSGAILESFSNLSLMATDARYALSVLNADSQIISVTETDDSKPVTDSEQALTGGVDDTNPLQPGDAAFTTALMGNNSTPAAYKLLEKVDLFNLLCIPGHTTVADLKTLQDFCRSERAMLIADSEDQNFDAVKDGPDSNLTGNDAINAAFYYPWVKAPDPMLENRIRNFPACGAVAGVYARTDATRGVWKAPAGTEASLSGVIDVTETLTDNENGVLNPQAVNCIRKFPVYGTIVWGARTLRGNDDVGSEWKYVPVRRTALFIEESLYRGLKWVVFEPNDDPLWAQIRLNVGTFMQDLFRQGAFQGTTPKEAYFVKCDKETTTQSDINRGIVNIVVGFAPLKPAEFVVIKLQQMAGQLAV